MKLSLPAPLESLVADLWRRRFVRFLGIGAVNTLFGYGLFFILSMSGARPAIALGLATIAGIGFNFLSTGSVVFAQTDSRLLWRFAAVYGAVYVANASALELLAGRGMVPALAQAVLLPVFVIVSYILNRNLVFTPNVPEAHS